ncbi:helix-turn-helix domain-containing protein [Mesorhizobium sp. B2-6-1]|nr:helix-turn-helix domain-containing protein [Mesorhizobium sp. B2-6-1]TPN35405.1 helix-turn-helix domain-containing protein [Mesorhizobium sp. B1-1-6]
MKVRPPASARSTRPTGFGWRATTDAISSRNMGTIAMPLLTPEEACAELGIGEDTLRAMRKAGEIPYINVGQGKKRETPRYELDDLNAWKARRKKVAECPSIEGPTPRMARSRTISSSAVADFLEALNAKRSGKPNR